MNRNLSARSDDTDSDAGRSPRGASTELNRRILLIGAESVVGANIAAEIAQKHQVVALTSHRQVTIDGCEMLALTEQTSPASWLDDSRPDAVIHCGPASRSAWDTTAKASIDGSIVSDAREWAAGCAERGCHFTFVSSDAVFTGPWMFHDEQSECLCPSAAAGLICHSEAEVLRTCPSALVIRTNAYGWTPAGTPNGWIEQILVDLERRSLQGYDYIRHATPILATDLADILLRAIGEHLSGVHHIAGAERVNPLQFAQRLADHFELPWLAVRRAEESLDEPAIGFGAGETSLQTKKIRKALCVAMPMLSEGLERLRRQQLSGFTDQLGPDTPVAMRQSA